MVPTGSAYKVEATPKPTTPVVILDATHRCDQCQAQAYVRVLTYHGQFEFCSHHWNVNADALAEHITADILDETWRLNEVAKLDVSA